MLLTPIILFVILMILLYVPPVQNFIRKQATAIASDATGMNISVERIDLRFPLNLLVRGVQVVQPGSDTIDIQHPDTLLNLGSLNIRVQAWPLLKGRVEVDDITLQRVAVNSSGLLEGMRIKGTLGRFFLASHGIDLNKEDAVLNRVELSDTHVQVMLADTTETPEDTTETALNWRVALHSLKLKNVSVDLQMPLDSMSLAATIGDASIEDAEADLKRQFYGWRKFALTGTSVNYDTGTAVPAEGFDASHIALRDIRIGIDSVMTCGRDMNAVIREFSMYDRSGLTVTSLTGRLFADSAVIRVPYLQLKTPHSEMNLTAQTYWKLVDIPTTGQLSARFNANIGKQDVLLFAGGLPETFKEAYPFRPLVIHAGTEGNLKQMQISRFTAELPGAFSLSGGGELWNLTDSLKRSGGLDFEMQTQDLNFLTGLTGVTPRRLYRCARQYEPRSASRARRASMQCPAQSAGGQRQSESGCRLQPVYRGLSCRPRHRCLAASSFPAQRFCLCTYCACCRQRQGSGYDFPSDDGSCGSQTGRTAICSLESVGCEPECGVEICGSFCTVDER